MHLYWYYVPGYSVHYSIYSGVYYNRFFGKIAVQGLVSAPKSNRLHTYVGNLFLLRVPLPQVFAVAVLDLSAVLTIAQVTV